ncbi:MAG: hypothetical protein JO057_20540, partial [Chloroflexi bacterium]|nr:hypothetical protein [Chloroflexota bacterium]
MLLRPVFDALSEALACLVNSLAHGGPCVLVLDDVQRVTSVESSHVLGYLCEHLPGSVRLVVAGRHVGGLPLGRLRARRMLLELGPDQLALDREQSRQVFAGLGVHVTPQASDALYARTEGWPAATYLAALAASHAPDPDHATRTFDGADPTIVDFLTTELLDDHAHQHLEFLHRTSVLERLSAPLCDAVLGRDDSAQVLAAMEQSNGFVIALDRRRQWYRYHHLFRQALQAELELRDPGQRQRIQRRASCWYEQHGDLTAAVEHALEARDEDRVAGLLAEHTRVVLTGTPLATLGRWLETLSDSVLRERPSVLVAGAWVTFQRGDLDRARRYLHLLQGQVGGGEGPLGEVSGESALALLKATLAWDGVSRIATQADLVRELEPRVSRAYRAAGFCLGASLFLQERRSAARDLLEDAAEASNGPIDIPGLAHALLALMDLEERRPHDAQLHLQAARASALRLAAPHSPASPLAADQTAYSPASPLAADPAAYSPASPLAADETAPSLAGLLAAPLAAAQAWLDMTRQDRPAARLSFEHALAVLPRAAVVPWLTIYLHIVLGRVALELDDLA